MFLSRFVAITILVSSITGCGASNGGGIFGGNNNRILACDPGTQVQLARPAPGQTGTGSLNSIEIVASGNANTLYQTYPNWQLQAQTTFGSAVPGGNLALVSDPSGPQPFASDFYYSSAFANLQLGVTYNVFLVQNSGCLPLNVGSFST